ncbi:membrane-bound PQQ-dependent dehydrogenase, glucose/quinate/shikimate family [Sphingomonas sp. YL-JM2C]
MSDQDQGTPVPPPGARPARKPRIFAAIMALFGAAMLYGGVELVRVGGSVFYLVAGAAMLGTAVLLWWGSRWAVWLYGALIALALGWTLHETGLDIWAMIPRLGFFYILFAWLLIPWARRGLAGGPALGHRGTRGAAWALVVAMLGVPLAALPHASMVTRDGAPSAAPGTGGPAAGGDWTAFGGTMAGTRFSTLDQITPANVGKLRVAWTYSFGDKVPEGLQVTPIKIGASVYACNGVNNIVSLDAETGRQNWRFDPKVEKETPFLSCRGVAYYKVPDAAGACAERIFGTTVDGRLIALDALTGRPCQGFGRNGQVSLLEGFGKVLPGYYSHTAAPTVARGRVVLGGTLPDNQYWGEPSGVIRAFDAVTGKLDWAYDVGKPDRQGAPGPGETWTHSTPNNWGQMAYDDALGLVYVPMGNATPDYFGAQRRPFDDEISSAVVALDVETGRRRWLFQTVHHDLWDYDLGSQPVLFDIPGPNGLTKALAQPTKRGEVFLVDRVTGKPLAPIEERPVSTRGHAPGERLSPTQPFPTDMPSLAGGLLDERMMWGLTPFDQMWCRIRFKEARYDGPMTPPGLTPSITYPGYLGGMDWGSASIDTDRGVMVVVTQYLANRLHLVTRAEALRQKAYPMNMGRRGLSALRGLNAMEGTPYAEETGPFLSPLKVPCQQPPWSRISAVDLKTKKILWSRPLGTGKETGPLGIKSHLPLPIGMPSLGGVLVTRGGLSFVGAAADRSFRAIETTTGKILWQVAIPESAHTTPMTYLGPKSGKQFVLVSAAGHRSLSLGAGDTMVAYRLP